MIVSLGVKWIIGVVRKTERWTSIFRHTGFGIGYLFCFFAPGNFYRQAQSHDTVTLTYLERLNTSWLTHVNALNLDKTGGRILLLFAILAYTVVVVMIAQHNKSAIKAMLIDIVPLIFGGGASVLVWAFGPRSTTYGMELWVLIVYSILLSCAKEIPFICEWEKWFVISVACAITVMVLFVKSNVNELWTYSRTSIERRSLIKEAVENNRKQVEVPRFDDRLSTEWYSPSLNNQESYDTDYCIRYYGTHIIIQE